MDRAGRIRHKPSAGWLQLPLLVAVLALAASCTQNKPPTMAQRNCMVAPHLAFNGEVATVYGRLGRILAEDYPGLLEDPVTRSFDTDWHVVQPETRIGDQLQTKMMRFSVKLQGAGPYRVLVSAQSQAAVVNFLHKTDIVKSRRVVNTSNDRTFVERLEQRISEGMELFAVDCDNRRRRPLCVDGQAQVFGDRADYAEPQLPERFAIGVPARCEVGPRFKGPVPMLISVRRDVGARRVSLKRANSGGFAFGCQDLPRESDDTGHCREINLSTFLNEAGRRLRDEGIFTTGQSFLPCHPARDETQYVPSLMILDWKDASLALNIIAAFMDEYDIAGEVNVVLSGVGCGTAG